LRVVVDYGQDPAWVVTAVEQVNDPRRHHDDHDRWHRL
jgi:hypothetical protein